MEPDEVIPGAIDVRHGDARAVLGELADASIDAVVTDPPYGLGFMGKAWDRAGAASFDPAFWREAARVMKPGAHLVAFGGTRTYHRLACAVEDAGLEVRDQLAWVFGQGFPKSLNVGEGRGTGLKPAWEPIVLARKPLAGTVAGNLAAHGTGALNIDACRVATAGEVVRFLGGSCVKPAGWQRPWMEDHAEVVRRENAAVERANRLGRWPANLAHDGSDEVLAAFAAYRELKSGKPLNRWHTDPGRSVGSAAGLSGGGSYFHTGIGDTGSAARFFYCAKASRADRAGSSHPTVKPVALMRWLVRLIAPPGGRVLDPFAGSGTTGAACVAEGRAAILIEREADYVADIRRRLAGAP